VTAVLGSGALTAIDRRDRKVGAMLRVLQREAEPVRTSAGAVAQVWRAGRRQVNLARTLLGLDVAVLDELAAKKVGELLGSSGTSELVDAHVALLVHPGARRSLAPPGPRFPRPTRRPALPGPRL
jgi:hypothetical protein